MINGKTAMIIMTFHHCALNIMPYITRLPKYRNIKQHPIYIVP